MENKENYKLVVGELEACRAIIYDTELNKYIKFRHCSLYETESRNVLREGKCFYTEDEEDCDHCPHKK